MLTMANDPDWTGVKLGRVPPSGVLLPCGTTVFPFLLLCEMVGGRGGNTIVIPPGGRKEREGLRRFTEACSLGNPLDATMPPYTVQYTVEGR